MIYQPSNYNNRTTYKLENENSSEKPRLNSFETLQSEGLTHLAEVAKFVEEHGPLDKLVMLGSGIHTVEGEIVPKNISEMNILAAIALKSLGLAQEVIITGGPTSKDTTLSESQITIDFLKKHFGEDFVDGIKYETASYSTIQNAENIIQFLIDKDNPTIGIIGQQWHVNPRAKMLFQEILSENGYNLDLALSSNLILKDFILFMQRHIQELKEFNPFIAEKLWFLSLEMKLVLHRFQHLDPFLGDGSKFGQLGVAAAYMIPPVRKYFESKANKRGSQQRID